MGQFSERHTVPLEGADKNAAGYPSWEDDMRSFPNLAEFLGRVRYTNGDLRETGSVLIFVDDEQLKVMFKEPNEGRVGFCKMESLEELLGGLERALEGQRIDWRRDKNRKRGYR